MDDPRFRIKPLQQVASACTGAMLTSLFMTPLDVIKTRIQVQQKTQISNKCFLYCNGLMDHLCPCGPNTPAPPKSMHLKGTLDGFLKISRIEGVSSLWSGLGPTLVSALPSTVVYFVAYEQIKLALKEFNMKHIASPNSDTLPLYVPLMSGISARILAVSVVSPLELIRTKMQSKKLSYGDLHKAVRDMVTAEGVLSMWKGLPPTLFRDVPFSGIYWMSYESLKKYFGVKEPQFAFAFFAGAVSGSISALITTPFDVVKTHHQIELGEKVFYADKPVKSIPRKRTFHSIQAIFRQNGVKGIFAGLGPRLAKVAPACAIMISTFEHGKSYFYKYNLRHANTSMS